MIFDRAYMISKSIWGDAGPPKESGIVGSSSVLYSILRVIDYVTVLDFNF